MGGARYKYNFVMWFFISRPSLAAHLVRLRPVCRPAAYRLFATCGVETDAGQIEIQLREEVRRLKAGEISLELKSRGVDTAGIFEKADLVERLVRARLSGQSCGTAEGNTPDSAGCSASSSTSSTSANTMFNDVATNPLQVVR